MLVGAALSVPLSALPWREMWQPVTRLVSDADGVLAEVCVHYCRAFHADAFPTLHDLFAALPREASIRVVVREASEYAHLRKALVDRGAFLPPRMAPVVTRFPITPWAKDRFGTLACGRRAVLAVPPLNPALRGPRANDARVPGFLSRQLAGLEARVLPFCFEGGDLIADRDTVFLAANCLARNQPLDVDARDELLRRIEDSLGKRVVVLGNRAADVPDHHIGMYLTPLGDRRVAVGDPDWGRRLCASPAVPTGILEVDACETRYARFRRVARELGAKGYALVPVPLVLTSRPRVYVSYNNSILERSRHGKHIYMPVYGIPALDAVAAGVFEREGWQVRPVRVGRLYRHTGSLRCLVGVIRREEAR
jgi:hypothetical protein